MAIVINGSGTVTGLAVGGLPDGTVDAGTLATNSVDSAELIDGAIDDSHMAAMAASKLTGALPAISGANLTGITADDNTPAFMALPHVDGDYIANTTWEKVLWTTEVYDTDGKFASSTFTPTVAGKYHFTCQIMWQQIDDNSNNHIALYKNGSEYHRVMFYSVNPDGGGGGPISSASLDVTAISDTDDYFEIYVYQSSGARYVRGTSHSTGSYFSAFKLAGA